MRSFSPVNLMVSTSDRREREFNKIKKKAHKKLEFYSEAESKIDTKRSRSNRVSQPHDPRAPAKDVARERVEETARTRRLQEEGILSRGAISARLLL